MKLYRTLCGGTAVFLLLASCSQPAKKKPVTDEVPVVATIDSSGYKFDQILDSADQSKAFNDVRFGMTEPEVEKVQDMGSISGIGNSQYFFQGNYDAQGKLYRFVIKGMPKTSNEYNATVLDDFTNLREVISRKYGTPDLDHGVPLYAEQKKDAVNFTLEWLRGDKKIQLGIGENNSEFFACLWIESVSLTGKVGLANEDVMKQKQDVDKNKF